MLDTLIDIDTSVFLFFNGMHNSFFDSFMMMFSGRFIWVPMYAALLVMVARLFTLRQTIAILIGVALVITMADQTCATLIRPVVERLRPSNPANPLSALVHVINEYRGGSYGFPSCHAANSFALAAFMSMIFANRRFTAAILIWAAVNSYSRIYLGVHYPGDLLVGAAIGTACAAICYALVKLIGYRGRKVAPTCSGDASVIFAIPSGFPLPIVSLQTINFRYTDIFATAAIATTLYIAGTSALS